MIHGMEPQQLFNVTVGEVDHTTVVLELAGELDIYTGPLLGTAVEKATGNGYRRMVLDLTRLGFLDSTGLGLMVDAQRRMHAKQGTVSVVCASDNVLQVFKLTGLDSVLSIVDTRERAFAAAA